MSKPGRRRRACVSTVAGAIVLVASGGGVAAQLQSISDAPCPFGVYIRGLAPSSSIGPTGLSALLKTQRCKQTVENAASDLLVVYEEALEELEATQHARPTLATLRLRLSLLETLKDTVFQIAAATDPSGARDPSSVPSVNECQQDLQNATIALSDVLARGTVYQTPARTSGKGTWTVSASFAQIEFDELDGRRLPPSERLDARVLVTAATYGLTERLDVGALVPLQRFDIPALGPTQPARRETDHGDLTLEAKWLLVEPRPLQRRRFDLSLVGRVTAPTGHEDDLMGSGVWSTRVGIAVDRPWPSSDPAIVPWLVAWVVSRGSPEKPGVGYHIGADVPLPANTGVFFGVSGEDDRTASYYANAFVGARLSRGNRAGPNSPLRPRRVWLDLKATVYRALEDEGLTASTWGVASVQVTW